MTRVRGRRTVPAHTELVAKFRVRIASGGWKPGERLPTQVELAAEYGVSQTTLRNALSALEVEKLVERCQGKTTTIARHGRDETRARFGRLVGPDGTRLALTIRVVRSAIQRASREQAARLGAAAETPLYAITRLRMLQDRAAIFERVFVVASLAGELRVSPGERMAEELLPIYQERFGITIARANEWLAVVPAMAEEAGHLGLPPGAPLLEITRVASDVVGWPVELRISRCDTARVRYATEVF